MENVEIAVEHGGVWEARLAKEGVKIDQPAKDMEWGWRHAYLRDPDGHEISLYWAGEKRFQKSPM